MARRSARKVVHSVLASVADFWHPTQIYVVRITLFVLFLATLIPKLGTWLLDNSRLSNSATIFIAFMGFEVLLAAARRPQEHDERSRTLQTRELGDELKEAFELKEVRLDFLCYSAETVFGLLVPLFFEIRTMRAERITIRILVRDFTKAFIVPCDRYGGEDLEYRNHIATRNAKIIEEFYSNVARVRRESPDLELSFEVRMHPFEPLQKAIIINRQKAYWCLYPIINAERILHGRKKTMWDYEGHSANLMELGSARPGLSFEMLQSIVTWFDTAWDNFSRPLTEDGIVES